MQFLCCGSTNHSQWWWFLDRFLMLFFTFNHSAFFTRHTGLFFSMCQTSLSHCFGTLYLSLSRFLSNQIPKDNDLTFFGFVQSNAMIKQNSSTVLLFARVARDATTDLKLFASKVLVQLRANDVMHRAASTRFAFFFSFSFVASRNRK